MNKNDEKLFKLDQDELEILKDFEDGASIRSENVEVFKERAVALAKSYLAKDARINIRISSDDLIRIKRLAVKEGLPYQTFIASILHKYVDSNISKL